MGSRYNNNQNSNYVPPVREFQETVVDINRVSKKTQGGNQMRFAALVVVGDRKGKVGAGLAKAPDVVSGIQKAISYAKKHLVTVPIRGTTIPYEISYKYGAAKILLKPAPAGSGIIAGGAVRAVLEAAGIKDVVAKMLGSNNKASNVYAVIEAFEKLNELVEKKGENSQVKKEE